jgi:hypothetical protein
MAIVDQPLMTSLTFTFRVKRLRNVFIEVKVEGEPAKLRHFALTYARHLSDYLRQVFDDSDV